MMILLIFFLFFPFLCFKGKIPTEIGKWTAVEAVGLDDNILSGIYGTYTCHCNFQSSRAHATKEARFYDDFANFFFIFFIFVL